MTKRKQYYVDWNDIDNGFEIYLLKHKPKELPSGNLYGPFNTLKEAKTNLLESFKFKKLEINMAIKEVKNFNMSKVIKND